MAYRWAPWTSLTRRSAPADPDALARRPPPLLALSAWAGLGASGISAACYGPETAFVALGNHPELGPVLAVLVIVSVAVVAFAYSQMFELFPSGGGSYRVASQLLGARFGLVAGSALLIDYVLAICVSLASGTDGMFSLLPTAAQPYKLAVELSLALVLVALNLRGIHVAIRFLLPIVIGFLIVHAFLIVYGVAAAAPRVAGEVRGALSATSDLGRSSGWVFTVALLFRAYGLGGSTYSGVEAVPNNVNLLAEPRVRTGRLTMLYVALTLGFTAGGLILLYSLWQVSPVVGRTLNAAAFSAIVPTLGLGPGAAGGLMSLTLALEAAILLVAANSTLIFAPSLLANMASDSWLPHQFRNLSVRLVRQNSVLFVGLFALVVLYWSRGSLALLVVFYSLNVFLSLALAKAGLLRYWWQRRGGRRLPTRLAVSALGLLIAVAILAVTLTQKFFDGGWATVCLTIAVIGTCLTIRDHYEWVSHQRSQLDHQFALPENELQSFARVEHQPGSSTAVLLTTEHWGPAIHTLLWVQRLFPGLFRNVLFVSVIEVDAAAVGAADALATRRREVETCLQQLEAFCAKCGLSSDRLVGHGTDPVQELEHLVKQAVAKHPDCVCFANNLILPPRRALAEWLHNRTALGLQRRLHAVGIPLMVMPIRLGW